MANTIADEAKKWVDSVNSASGGAAGWRLEVLSKTYRKKVKDKDPTETPLRIRRFVRGLPWALLHEAVKYLLSIAPYEKIIYNGVPIDGKYRPTITRWIRDDQERVNGQATGSYTLVQDLIQEEIIDEYKSTTSGNCSEEIVTTWRWDDPDVVDITTFEDYGAQGISYSIQAVHRTEDGSFEYAVVKRISKTQHTSPLQVECDEYFITTSESWNGLYGDPSTGFRDSSGSPVTVPEPCQRPDGTVITRQVTVDQDCTYRVSIQTRTAKVVPDVNSTCTKTIFEHRDTRTDQAVSSRTGEAPSAQGGVIKAFKSEKRQDGLYNVTSDVRTELPVSDSSVEHRKTLRGSTTTTVNRNVSSPLNGTNMKIGEVRRSDKTEGGLYNTTRTEVANEPVGLINVDCTKTIFEHQHTTTENVKDEPSKKEVSEASGGVVHRLTARATEEGSWDVTEQIRTETPAPETSVEHRKTLRGATKTTVNRNVSSPLDGANMKIGEVRRSDKTEGGLYNTTRTEVANEPVGLINVDCTKTIFEHQHTTTENVKDEPSKKEVSEASGGVVHRLTARATEEGSWDVTDQVRTETPVSESSVEHRKTLRGSTTTTVNRNVSSPLNGANMKIGEVRRSDKTEGGLYNTTRTEVANEDVGNIAEVCSATSVMHSHSITDNVKDKPSDVEQGDPGVNTEKVKTVRITETGSWDVETRTVTHKPFNDTIIATVNNPSQIVQTHVFQNSPEIPSINVGPGQNVSANVSRNNVGSYDGSYRVVKGKPFRKQEIARADNASQTVKIEAFQNLDNVPPMVAGPRQSISANASRNELGLFDGTCRVVEGKPLNPLSIATVNNDDHTEQTYVFLNLESVPSNMQNLGAEQGKEVSASVSRNEFGLFDGKYVVSTGHESTRTVTTNNSLEIHTIAVTKNYGGKSYSAAKNERASLQHMSNGNSILHSDKVIPRPVDSGWIEWESKEETTRQIVRTHHQCRIFRNMGRPPIEGLNGSVSVQVSINEYGLYDGVVRVSKLIGWEDKGGYETGGSSPFEFEEEMISNGLTYTRKVSGTMYSGTLMPTPSMIPKNANYISASGGILRVGIAGKWGESKKQSS